MPNSHDPKWKFVPVEPTERMCSEGESAASFGIGKPVTDDAIKFMLIRLTHADTSARTIGIPEQSRSAPLEG